MRAYLGRRVLHALIAVVGVITIVFFLTRLSGDPAILFTDEEATPEQRLVLRKSLGLDQPVHIQYFQFIGRVFTGDFPVSLRFKRSSLELVLERLPATIELAIGAQIVALGLGIPFGVIAAQYRRSILARVIMFFSLFNQAMPSFWLGLVLMILFGSLWQVLPISGRGSLAHIVLPAIVLASNPIARITRLLRGSLLDTLSTDYVRTARSKGLPERIVVYKHALRNAIIPVITYVGINFAHLVGGAVVVETIFAWPGVGRFAVQAVYNRDYPAVQASVLFGSAVVVLMSIVIDFLYAVIDPRIRYT